MTSVNTTRTGPLAVIELARPSQGNALDAALVTELTDALIVAAASGVRAVVLTGAGKHFCSGADLAELEEPGDAAAHLASAERLGRLFLAVLRCPLLTVVAVRGAAFGGGAGLAAACDVVIAAPDARFQFSEVRLGFVPALVSVFLPRRVAPARLAHLFLDPAPLDGDAARAVGLVDEVAPVPLDRARDRALAICRKAAPAAIAETKRLLLEAALPDLDRLIAEAAHANAAHRDHPECRRGVSAFLATKAFPEWLEE